MRFIKLISINVLVLFINTNCINRYQSALEYSMDFTTIVNDIGNDFDNLLSKVDSVDKQLDATHTIDTLLVNSCFSAVRQFESKLVRLENKLGQMSSYGKDDNLKIKTTEFLKTSRREILPIYSRFFEATYEEYVKYPISLKNGDEPCRTNQNIIKVRKSLMGAITTEYRVTRIYYDFVDSWTKNPTGNSESSQCLTKPTLRAQSCISFN